jgi:multiple antibiotic resistance protein
MLADQSVLLTQIVTLTAVLDPVGHLALFLTTTAALDRRSRRRVAVLAVLISLAILTAIGFIGQYVLNAMGISLLSFQIAGGIVLFLYSLTMVLGEPHTAAAPDDPGDCLTMAIHPLAVPIIAGPGSMLTLMVLMDNNRFSIGHQLITVLALVLVLVVLLAVFLLGDVLVRVLGSSVINVLRRIMGLVLAALSVNLVLTAVVQWLGLPPI